MADGEAAPTTEPTSEAPRSLSLLASEMFGSSFLGELKNPEAAPEETPPPEAPVEGGEAAPEAPEAPETADVEEEPVASLTQLIEMNEWDPEWVHGLKIPVKVDGKPSEATLKDLVDGYQMRQAAEHRLEEAKAKAKALNEDIASRHKQAEEQLVTAAELIRVVESKLNDEAAAINWRDLRDRDPAEYAAKKAEIKERRDELDAMKAKAVTAWQQAQAAQAEEQKKTMQQRLQAEHAALLEKIPEWRDSERAKADKAKLAEYLTGQGFTREEIMGASDHRLLLMARKAMRLDEIESKTDAARKKVVTVPKVLKPGAPKPAEQQAKDQDDKLRSRLRKTGSIDDAFALLKARRKTGG